MLAFVGRISIGNLYVSPTISLTESSHYISSGNTSKILMSTFLEILLDVVTVNVAVPAVIPFITPLDDTVAISSFDEEYVIFLFVVLLGDIIPIIVIVLPTCNSFDAIDISISSAYTSFTVTLKFFIAVDVSIVIVAVPTPLAVKLLPSTLTTLSSLDVIDGYT